MSTEFFYIMSLDGFEESTGDRAAACHNGIYLASDDDTEATAFEKIFETIAEKSGMSKTHTSVVFYKLVPNKLISVEASDEREV